MNSHHWDIPTAIKRQANAADFWMELTGRKQAAVFEVAKEAMEKVAGRVPPLSDCVVDDVEAARRLGVPIQQLKRMLAEKAAADLQGQEPQQPGPSSTRPLKWSTGAGAVLGAAAAGLAAHSHNKIPGLARVGVSRALVGGGTAGAGLGAVTGLGLMAYQARKAAQERQALQPKVATSAEEVEIDRRHRGAVAGGAVIGGLAGGSAGLLAGGAPGAVFGGIGGAGVGGVAGHLLHKRRTQQPREVRHSIVLTAGPKDFRVDDYVHHNLANGDTLSVHKSIAPEFYSKDSWNDQHEFLRLHLGKKAHLFSPVRNIKTADLSSAAARAIGGAAGAVPAGIVGFLNERARHAPGAAGKSRFEIKSERELAEHLALMEHLGKPSKLQDLKKKFLELQLQGAVEGRESPNKAALLGMLPYMLAAGSVGAGVAPKVAPWLTP